MGFVEYYIIVLFFIGALASMYYTGQGDKPKPSGAPMIVDFTTRWLVLLPMVGRIFGWW